MLVNDILNEINSHINIISNIDKISFFNSLTDEFIINFVNSMIIAGASDKLCPNLIKLSNQFANRKFKKLHKLIHSETKLDIKELAELYGPDKYEIYNASYGYCNNSKFNPLNNVSYYTYDSYKGYVITNNQNVYMPNHTSYVYIVYEKPE
jgi:oligoribonuclease (3'-5' exoribonuclease)